MALLREQLRLREAELATLRAARPGACARCAEVALALAAHPAFRPRTGSAADWEAWDARQAARGGAPGAGDAGGGGADGGGAGSLGLGGELSADGGGRGARGALAALAAAPPRLAAAAAAAAVWLALLDAAALPLFAAYAAALALATPAAAPGGRATLALAGAAATAGAALALAARSARLAAALAAYVAWLTLADGAPRRGGRPLRALRAARLWRQLAAAHGVTLHKTADLDPAGAYVIAYAPPGHVSPAALLAFAAPRAAGWAAAFPGVDARVLAPPGAAAFGVPLLREGLLALGLAEGTDSGVHGALTRGTVRSNRAAGGVAVVVPLPLPGGAAAAGAPPVPFDAAAAARRRVARAALRAGASVVPAYGFGDAHESELPGGGGGGGGGALRRLLGVSWPGAPGALAPAADALAAQLAPRLPPRAAAALRAAAAALAPPPAAPRAVRVVLGHPFACPAVPHPSEALVDDVAARLWREMAALAAAHAAPEDDAPR